MYELGDMRGDGIEEMGPSPIVLLHWVKGSWLHNGDALNAACVVFDMSDLFIA